MWHIYIVRIIQASKSEETLSFRPQCPCHTELWSAVGFGQSPHSRDRDDRGEFVSHGAVFACNFLNHCCPPTSTFTAIHRTETCELLWHYSKFL